MKTVAAIVCLFLATPAGATDRYYPDSSGLSPNGRFRIDAKSPDNAGQRRPFAANFTYTLTDTATKKTVWQRKQPMTRSKGSSYAFPAEASPVAVFVTDEGLVVARLSADSLLILDAKDGAKRVEAEVLRAFPKSEHDQFVSMTTAGPMWSQESDWYFLRTPHDKKLYFVVRPFWHHRLIVDTVTGKHVDLGVHHSAASTDAITDPALKTLLATAIEEEAGRAIAGLTRSVDALKNDPEYRGYFQIRASLHTVAFLRLENTEPLLRTLESSLDDTNDRHAGLRGKVREALRAIGKVPIAGYGVRLYPLVAKDNYFTHDIDLPFTGSVPTEDRTANASKVAAGITVKDLTNLIGCPDARLFDGDHCYDYDIDASPPYTLRVFLSRGENSVASVKTISPLAFLHDPSRMRSNW